jgi:hypothetical protein
MQPLVGSLPARENQVPEFLYLFCSLTPSFGRFVRKRVGDFLRKYMQFTSAAAATAGGGSILRIRFPLHGWFYTMLTKLY